MLSQPKSAMAAPQRELKTSSYFEKADSLLEQQLTGNQFH
jgi:hypothetical protein